MPDNIMSVDELRDLLQSSRGKSDPAPSTVPSSPGVGGGNMTVEELREAVKKPAGPSIGVGEDVARAAGSGVARGVVGLAGLPGDIETLGRAGAKWAGYDVSPETVLPTSADMIKKAETYIPGAEAALNYKPQHSVGRYAKTAGEFLPGAVIGPGGLGTKIAGSIGAGIGSQGVEDWMKGTKYENTPTETALKIVASIPGYMAGTKVAGVAKGATEGLVMPGQAAKNRAVDTLQADAANAGAKGNKMRPEDIAGSGADTTLAAVGGENTKKMLENAAGKVSDNTRLAYNAQADEMARKASGNLANQIDTVFGETVAPLSRTDDILAAARIENGANYQRAMSAPHAQQIMHPELMEVLKRSGSSTLNHAFDILEKRGIDPLSVGFINHNGRYAIGPNGLNLRFWDQLKKSLDAEIVALKDPITGKIKDRSLHDALNDNVKMLRDRLDLIVPEYGVARGAAAESAGAINSLDLGMKYLDTSGKNLKALENLEKVRASLTPEHQMEFARGVAGAIKGRIENDPTYLSKLFTGKDATLTTRKLQTALEPLGADAADKLIGYASVQSLNQKIPAINPASHPIRDKILSPEGGGLAALALGTGEGLLQAKIFTGAMDPASFIMAALAYGGGKIYSWKEKRVAERLMQLAQDPSKVAEIGKLVRTDPSAQTFLGKAQAYAKSKAKYPVGAGTSMNEDDAPPLWIRPDRPGRKSGGRISSHEAEADRLIMAAERAKKGIGQKTQSILEKPDEIVVQALKRANQALEA